LYCDLVEGAVLTGLQAELVASGEDIGASEEPLIEGELQAESVPVEQIEPEVLTEVANTEGDQGKEAADSVKDEEDKAS
jgi:small subunit ribosomal protein S2